MLGFTLNDEQDAFRVAVRSRGEGARPRVEELERTETFPLDLFRELGRPAISASAIPRNTAAAAATW